MDGTARKLCGRSCVTGGSPQARYGEPPRIDGQAARVFELALGSAKCRSRTRLSKPCRAIASRRPLRLIYSTAMSCMNSPRGIGQVSGACTSAQALRGPRVVRPAGRAGRSFRCGVRRLYFRELPYDRIRPRRCCLPSLLSGQGTAGLDRGGGQEGRRLPLVRQARVLVAGISRVQNGSTLIGETWPCGAAANNGAHQPASRGRTRRTYCM
jgi:hypothetical protein